MTGEGENISGWIWGGGVAAGYMLVLWGNPAHSAFRAGFRCIVRYPVMIRALAGLGFLFAISDEIFRLIASGKLSELQTIVWWEGWNPPDAREAVATALLPAFESATGIFHSMMTGFPFTALAAILFCCNWSGSLGILHTALRVRYPIIGFFLLLLFLVSAVCATLKPVLYLGYEFVLTHASSPMTVQIIEIIRHSAFLFEHTFAVWVQVFLITVAYVWVRGMSYNPDAIREFSLRRLGVVMRWALPLYGISVLLLEIPSPWPREVSRLLMGLILLAFPVVQMRLIFHNRTVREALNEQALFWRRHAMRFFWLIVTASAAFLGLATLDAFMHAALGPTTGAGIGWNLFYPFLWAPFGAWMLASWVCLYKQIEKSKPGVDDWVAF